MSPTLKQNQILLAKSLNYSKKAMTSHIDIKDELELNYLDIIVFNFIGKLLIKRVVGFPQDNLVIEDQLIKVNDNLIFEFSQEIKQYYDLTISDNSLFVIGDNPYNSLDSRKIGLISMDQVTGKIKFRIWPPKIF